MSTTMAQLGKFVAELHNQQDAKIKAMEARLTSVENTIVDHEIRITELENKPGCECGTFDDFMGAFENTEGEGDGEDSGSTEGDSTEDNTGGSTEIGGDDSGSGNESEGEDGGSTEGEGEGEGDDSGSTEPMTASQALAEYDHLIGVATNTVYNVNNIVFMSEDEIICANGWIAGCGQPIRTVASILEVNEGDIVKVYTPDLQEIEIIADSSLPYYLVLNWPGPMAFGNKETKEVYCYHFDEVNMVVSPCTDEAFIAQWGNSDALGL